MMQLMDGIYLQVLRDQSSYSSWYFIEQASIGNINANVTIALTSSVLSGRGGVGTAAETGAGGLFSRAIGASGFQLININNVPLSLREWNMQSKLLGRNALINSMIRHYRNAAISEAHKASRAPSPSGIADRTCACISLQLPQQCIQLAHALLWPGPPSSWFLSIAYCCFAALLPETS